MKKTIPIILAIVLFASIGSVALAAKPQENGAGKDVITLSNGFPSGAHYNLNIHGKNDSYACVPYDATADSHNVVNMPEYGTGTITYVSGKKVKIDELTVFDACTESFDTDPAEVWLPYETEGYYVFARALGKPSNGNGGVVSSIIIENGDLTAYTPIIGDISSPDDLLEIELPLGLITNGGDYKLNSTTDAGIELVRFDSEPAGKGKGKTLGKDITDMFMFYGYVFQPVLDTTGDGKVNFDDVPASYDTNGTLGIQQDEFDTWLNDNTEGYVFPLSLDTDLDGDVDYDDVPLVDVPYYDSSVNGGDDSGLIDNDTEFHNWVSDNLPSGAVLDDYLVALWEYYDEENPIWVFNIADLVFQNQVFTNDGIKNLQIRFYPVATTTFESAE